MTQDSERAGIQYAMQAYQERYSEITSAISRIMQEVRSLQEVVGALKARLSGRGAMVDAGMGFYVSGSISQSDKVIVAIGGNMLAERSAEDAVSIANERIEARNAALRRLMAERKELENAVYELSRGMQEDVG